MNKEISDRLKERYQKELADIMTAISKLNEEGYNSAKEQHMDYLVNKYAQVKTKMENLGGLTDQRILLKD